MHNAFSTLLGLIAPLCLVATISNATAAPSAKAAEDRYIAARDAAIEKISAIYDAGNADDAARKAEDAASADLAAQMRAILNEAARTGFGPANLHIDTFNKGDEGFGMLDGLRFDAMAGKNGDKAGQDGADGKYVEPKAHIVVTSQTLFERWLLAHKKWWGNNVKNVPQQIGAALKDENFYTQAVSSGSAVVKACRRDLCVWDAGGSNPVGHSRRRRHRVRLGDRQRQGVRRLRFDRSQGTNSRLHRHPG
jgi:hypothetical protein